jgi:DNA-binding NtrC family response regulator
MTDDLLLTARHFGGSVAPPGGVAPGSVERVAAAPPTLPERRAELERDAIRGALAETGGNRVAAAKLLKISRATLYEKLARYPELARG